MSAEFETVNSNKENQAPVSLSQDSTKKNPPPVKVSETKSNRKAPSEGENPFSAFPGTEGYHHPPFPMPPFGFPMYHFPPMASAMPPYPFKDAQADSSSSSYDRGASSGSMMTPFPVKLYEMLEVCEKEGKSEITSFFPHGRAFAIHDPQRFVDEIMPRFFRQTKLTSFQRQLNLYGFRRISQGQDSGGYYHELFLKGRPELAQKMKRVKVKGNQRSTTRVGEDPNFYQYPPLGAEKAMGPPHAMPPFSYDCVMPPYYFYMYPGAMGPYQAAQAEGSNNTNHSELNDSTPGSAMAAATGVPVSSEQVAVPLSIPPFPHPFPNIPANYPRTLPKHSPVVPLSQQKPFTPLKWLDDGWADFSIPDTPMAGDPVQLLGVDSTPSSSHPLGESPAISRTRY